MEEQLDSWEMPETNQKELIAKIKAITWDLRNDYTSPKHQIKKIIELIEKLEALSEVAPKQEQEEINGFKACEIGKENHDIYRRGDFFLCRKCNFKVIAE